MNSLEKGQFSKTEKGILILLAVFFLYDAIVNSLKLFELRKQGEETRERTEALQRELEQGTKEQKRRFVSP